MAKDIFTAEWFPYYFERFEGSDKVAVMSLAEEGAYHRAIRLAWKYGSIPADPEMLAAKIQKRCTAKVAAVVLKCFEPVPNQPSRMMHPVIEGIRAEQEEKYLNKVKGGKAAAEARKLNAANKDTSSTTEQCSSNASAHKEREKEKEREREDGEAASPPPLKEIEIGKGLSGITKALGLQTLTPNQKSDWAKHIGWAVDNNFAAQDFVDCFCSVNETSRGTPKPEWVCERLPGFLKKRRKIEKLPTPEQNRADAALNDAAIRPAPTKVMEGVH